MLIAMCSVLLEGRPFTGVVSGTRPVTRMTENLKLRISFSGDCAGQSRCCDPTEWARREGWYSRGQGNHEEGRGGREQQGLWEAEVINH